MDIRSLRIGDIVTTNGIPACSKRGDWYKIIAIDGKDTFTDKNGVKHIGNVSLESVEDEYAYIGGAWVNYLEPIPITDELLEKVGFKNTDIPIFWIHNEFPNISVTKPTEFFENSLKTNWYHFSCSGLTLKESSERLSLIHI